MKFNLEVEIKTVATIGQTILQSKGSHAPMLFLFCEQGTAPMLFNDMPEMEKRADLFYRLGQSLHKQSPLGEVNGIIFVSEAWKLKLAKDEKPNIRPSGSPKRKECLMVVGMRADGTNKTIMLDFDRDQNQKIINLKETAPDTQPNLLISFWQGYENWRIATN